MRVVLFRDLPLEGRTTMNLYATRLRRALERYHAEDCRVEEFPPRHLKQATPLPTFPLAKKLHRYYARFLAYPRLAKKAQGEINHVVDHAYSHLLYALDPQRTVVTCHDLFLLRLRDGAFPLTFRPRIAIWAFQYSLSGLRRAARVLADSEATRHDLLAYGLCREEQIQVIYLGIDDHFHPVTDEAKLQQLRQKYALPEAPLLLHVGDCDPYKGIETLLEALSILVHTKHLSCHLVKAGGAMAASQERLAKQLGIDHYFSHLGRVPEEDLPGLYSLATVFAFPSLHEGFGWPPLEAMACGVPVIATTAGALPEVIGEAGLLVPPSDAQALAEAIAAVITNPHLAQQLSEQGQQQARRFPWEATAHQVFAIYREVAQGIASPAIGQKAPGGSSS